MANHYRNVWKDKEDPSRCDFSAPAALARPLIRVAGVPIIQVTSSPGVSDLARRDEITVEQSRVIRSAYTIRSTRANVPHARDVCALQTAWDQYKDAVCQQFPPVFWKFFLPIHHLATNAIDSALKAAKDTFIPRRSPSYKQFAASKRSLFDKLNRIPNQFWPLISHTCQIDLTSFDLPSGTRQVTFKFIDPVWGWLVAARRLHPLDLHWKPVCQRDRNPVYGGGVQYGQAFIQGCDSCPEGTYPMFFKLLMC